MDKIYIHNLETSKIELKFDKAAYQELTAEEKRALKSAYLWSRYAGAWVSRSTKNHFNAIRTAEALGFANGGREGERLSYAEEMEIKAEKAERRAGRYEHRAEKAIQNGEQLQAGIKAMHGDISFFTQPNINTSAGRAFKNRREKMFQRYNQGFQEYRKSAYYKDRAETARAAADMKQLKDPVYLDNRINEQNSIIRKLEKNIVSYEEKLYRIEQGETLTNYKGEELTAEQYNTWINDTLDRMEYEIDKLAYFENAQDELRENLEAAGKKLYSQDDIKPGYLIKLRHNVWAEVKKVNPKTVEAYYIEKPLKGLGGRYPYAEIRDLKIPEGWIESKGEIKNPYEVGDILYKSYIGDGRMYQAFQIIKTTPKTVTLQEIEIENGKPIKDKYKSSKQQRKTIKEDRQNNIIVVLDSWQLYKYNAA